VPGGGIEPPRAEARRILSSTVGSELLGKFYTLLYFSTGYQNPDLYLHDPFSRVLNMELLQFYYSVPTTSTFADVSMVPAGILSERYRLVI
jgi:hypothetical protein